MSRPASASRSVAALARWELGRSLRGGESLLATLAIPVAVLLFFASVGGLPGIVGRPVDFLLPGSIALAIVAGGLVNLGIATAYERSYGVLKRLGGAPLPRWGLLAGKLAAVAVLAIAQVALLLLVAGALLGWTPGPGASPVLLAGSVALGTLAFSSLGLVLAGTLRAEAVLALANGLFLALLMLGGIVLPVDQLPAPLPALASLLPATALADLLRISLASGLATSGPASPVGPVLILSAWGVGAGILATRWFRWD